MNNTIREIFARNGFISVPTFEGRTKDRHVTMVATILSNMAHYGYVPSVTALDALRQLNDAELKTFWTAYKSVLSNITGANRNMEKHVVYKNFPKEVLDMSQAQYWFSQIFMYLGAPNDLFTQEEVERDDMLEKLDLKVLQLADANTAEKVYLSMIGNASRWSDNQTIAAKALYDYSPQFINVDDFKFKENGIVLVAHAIQTNKNADYDMSNATDVLRLCAFLSGGDVSLRTNVRFKKLSRSQRKKFLAMINSSKNLIGDFGMRPEVWKRLLSILHPGDYPQFTHVTEAYNQLYNDSYETFNSKVDALVKDVSVLNELQTRPGEFMRRLHAAYKLFGNKAFDAFRGVASKLNTTQLLKLNAYLNTINYRNNLMFAPKGNWTKVQIAKNEKVVIQDADLKAITEAIDAELRNRVNALFPEGVQYDPRLEAVKLQTNDQKLAEYGRGTTFDIPENIKFIRSASYWECARAGNVWFDNGWNFFDDKWNALGTCAWNTAEAFNKAAVFSGDPTNSKDMKGRACQMIDLYIDKLVKSGVRYAVWNILCYSNIPFDQAGEVLGTLQMGEEAQKGKLYEPSRAQMVFPITGNSKTKYVAFIDLKLRKLVYMDANLKGNVSSAVHNASSLQKVMPAYCEYLDSLPSVADLFKLAKPGSTPVLYSDEDVSISEGKAYVFKPLNADNKYEKILLSDVL